MENLLVENHLAKKGLVEKGLVVKDLAIKDLVEKDHVIKENVNGKKDLALSHLVKNLAKDHHVHGICGEECQDHGECGEDHQWDHISEDLDLGLGLVKDLHSVNLEDLVRNHLAVLKNAVIKNVKRNVRKKKKIKAKKKKRNKFILSV